MTVNLQENIVIIGNPGSEIALGPLIWNEFKKGKSGTWNPEPGTRNLEPGTWNLEPGTWNYLCTFLTNSSTSGTPPW